MVISEVFASGSVLIDLALLPTSRQVAVGGGEPSNPLVLKGRGLAGYHGLDSRNPMQVVLTSKITCPQCGAAASEEMPTDACVYFYECTGCQTLLHPLDGDCCVFCSYGDVKCPPVQVGQACCADRTTP